jgi:outer membrane protein TolC
MSEGLGSRWRACTRLFLVALTLALPARLGAQESTERVTVNLATAAQLAAQRNYLIRAAQQDVATACQVLEQAKGARRLSADLNASYYRLDSPIELLPQTIVLDGTEIVIPGEVVSDVNPYFANVNARYPLYNAGRLRYDVRRAGYGVEEARNSSEEVALNTVLKVTRVYLSAIYGRENVRLNEESLKSYQAHLQTARGMRKEGVATDYDVTSAEAAVSDQEKRLTEARNQYALALDNLRTALVVDRCATVELEGSFFSPRLPLEACQAEETAVRTDPLLKSLADRSCGLQMAEKSILAEFKPQLDLVLFANLLNREKGSLTNAQWSVGAQLSQVVLDGGVIRARAGERRSQRAKTDLEYAGREDDVRLAVRSAYLDMDTARSAIAAGQKSVELARESLRLANRRYAEGVGTSLEVLDANVNLLAAQTSLQRSWFELDAAYLAARRYIGDLLQVAQVAQSLGLVSLEEGSR